MDRSRAVAEIRNALACNGLERVLKASDDLIRQEPANFEGYFWQGLFELKRKDAYAAVRSLRRAEKLDANVWVLNLLAVSYYDLRQYRLFILKMNEAIQGQPEEFSPHYYLVRYYVSDGVSDFSEAAECLRKATDRKPDHFRPFYYLGFCHEAERNLGEAEQCYQRSMSLAQAEGANFSLPYEGLARVRLMQNRPADALGYARNAVRLNPDDAGNHNAMPRRMRPRGCQRKQFPNGNGSPSWILRTHPPTAISTGFTLPPAKMIWQEQPTRDSNNFHRLIPIEPRQLDLDRSPRILAHLRTATVIVATKTELLGSTTTKLQKSASLCCMRAGGNFRDVRGTKYQPLAD